MTNPNSYMETIESTIQELILRDYESALTEPTDNEIDDDISDDVEPLNFN